MRSIRSAFIVGLACLVGACASAPKLDAGCPSGVVNASYTGPYKGVENRLSADAMALDLRCAERFKSVKYPQGFVAIYGSSRIGEDNAQADADLRRDNNELYQAVKRFAFRWTQAHGSRFPIMTGAGPGLMEAASRGATEAGGPSIGYTTYYGPARDKADPGLAFQRYRDKDGVTKDIVSDGLIFTSVAVREAMMISHSAAIVIAPGGTGTEWEISQIMETLKSLQLDPVPVFLIGNKARYWQSFERRIAEMNANGTLRRSDVDRLFVYVENVDDLFDLLQSRMQLH